MPDPLQDDDEIRVLIVDDEKVIRNLLQLSMQRMGYSVVTAVNGREALEMFKEQQFDLVTARCINARTGWFPGLC